MTAATEETELLCLVAPSSPPSFVLEGALLDVAREGCTRHFWPFFRHGFGAAEYCRRSPKDDWVDETIHRAFCNEFERHVRWWMDRREHDNHRYIILNVWPRKMGKSTTITEAGSLWCSVIDPNLCIGIGSYNDEKAQDFLSVPKTIMEGRASNGLFKELYGTWTTDKWNESELVHSWRTMPEIRDPSFECCSVKAGSTGSAYDIYFLDDPIPDRSSKDVSTQLQTDVQQAVSHVRKMWPVMKKNALFVINLTRKADNDVAAYAMKKFRVREFADTGCKPREFEYKLDPEKGRVFVNFLSGRDSKGVPTCSKVWSDDEMKDFESRDPANYASEVQNMPAEGSHVSLKEADIKYVKRKDVPPNLRYVLLGDTAFKEDNVGEGNENAIVQAGLSKDGLGDVYYFWARHSNLWSSKDYYAQLVIAAQELLQRRLSVWCITDEKERGGKAGLFSEAYVNNFRAAGLVAPRLIQFSRAGKSKPARINAAKDYWMRGKVYLVEGGEGLDVLEHQMLRLGYTALDDVADAAADAFHPDVYFGERIGVNLEKGGPARRPFETTPIHMMRPEEKAQWQRNRITERERDARRVVNLPWWRRPVE